MENILNNITKIKELDRNGVAKSISLLPEQCEQVLKDFDKIIIPKDYKNFKEIVANGMGGSSIGIRIIKSSMSDKINVPILITPGYDTPSFISKNTLYIISSYSGGTEEPISVYKEVKKKGAKIIAIASAGKGKLQTMMKKYGIPGYNFIVKNNPSMQPRLGVGYMVFSTVAIMIKTGVLRIQIEELKEMIRYLKVKSKRLLPGIILNNNEAKKIAAKLYNYQPIIVGAQFLSGNTYALRNQINESSKNFSSYLLLPELNHYSMEGLSFPKSNKNTLVFLFLESDLFHKRVQKRIKLTKEVVKKNGIKIISLKLNGKTKFIQAFEMLQLGSWVSYYLGILNGVDPVKIPWVDWFKEKLK